MSFAAARLISYVQGHTGIDRSGHLLLRSPSVTEHIPHPQMGITFVPETYRPSSLQGPQPFRAPEEHVRHTERLKVHGGGRAVVYLF
jgi:hypothetical protein